MKIPLSIFAGLAVGIVGYLVYKKMYATGTTAPANPATPAPPGSAPNTATAAAKIPIDAYKWLEKGSRDAAGRAEVKYLQSLLGVQEDGVFGAGTESALALATNGKKKITFNQLCDDFIQI